MRPVRLLGLSGSIRQASSCTAILHTLRESLGMRGELTVFALGDVPPYNEDHDSDALTPAIVVQLRAAVRAADGLVVISPEYNHGMSGMLKNAIDWVSRPASASPLANKPVSVMTAASSPLGGARAQAQLRETFASTNSRVMANRQVVIGEAGKKIAAGRLTHQPTLDFALAAIDVMIAEIGLLDLGRAHGMET